MKVWLRRKVNEVNLSSFIKINGDSINFGLLFEFVEKWNQKLQLTEANFAHSNLFQRPGYSFLVLDENLQFGQLQVRTLLYVGDLLADLQKILWKKQKIGESVEFQT